MTPKWRVPITAITVFATTALLVLSVGIVLYLGFGQAAESTRKLWAGQAKALIDEMQRGLDDRLRNVREQAQWVAQDVSSLSDMESLDAFMFGALAATPQVAGTAVIATDGRSRRWHRREHVAISEDWSAKEWLADYLRQVEATGGPAWREPIFEATIDSSTLLHDIPLQDSDGRFIGVFAQIVPLTELSRFLATRYADTGTTPFILYNHDFVLAHPAIGSGDAQRPLARIDQLGDVVLERIWKPDERAPFLQRALQNTQAQGIFLGDNFFLYLYRDIDYFGPAPWTIGAYLNTNLLSDKPADTLIPALIAGVVVLVLAVLASIYVGRRVSNPIKAFVAAAERVDAGDLEHALVGGNTRIREFDDAGIAFNAMVRGLRERRLILDTLGRFVPERIAHSLLAGGGHLEVQQSTATILFCDLEAFTRLTETVGPVKIVEVLNAYFSAMVEILERHSGVVTQFQGDAILATFNVPIADPGHARNAVAAAQEMLACVARETFAGERLRIRIGINTGPVVAGAIGARGRLNYTVHGDAVNLAARLEALNKEFGTRLLISAHSAELIPHLAFCAVGETRVRGQSGTIGLFTLAGGT